MRVSNLTSKTRNWTGWQIERAGVGDGGVPVSRNYQSSWDQDVVLLSLALNKRRLQCPRLQCSGVGFLSLL